MSSISYAWARHLEAANIDREELTDAAKLGYEAALELAEDAYECSLDPRRYIQLEPLTLEQLAPDYGLTAAELSRYINLARRQLFGEITDAAIYKRLARQKGRKRRGCAEAGCTDRIPAAAPPNKIYCDEHASNAARVRRHRTRKQVAGVDYGHSGQNANPRLAWCADSRHLAVRRGRRCLQMIARDQPEKTPRIPRLRRGAGFGVETSDRA